MTNKFKMTCGCYYNCKGFKVGRKYLSIYHAYVNKTIDRTLLTPAIIERLEEIKAETRPEDVRRTYLVMCMFGDPEED